MEVELVRHALDRVPLSLIIDDSAALVNLNYFFIRDRNADAGEDRRWQDLPVVIPEPFTREWAQWCAAAGVRGKFSVVPCPAGLGRVDHGLPLFGAGQLESWLRMCREVIVPHFDITPEMLTHTRVLDLETLRPAAPRLWEQWDWEALPEAEEERVFDYIALSCRILANVGLPPQGVTSPGGFGGRTLPFYARVAGAALRAVTGDPAPYFFKRIESAPPLTAPVWYPDRACGTAVGEIIACSGDWTGSWTGYGEVDPDRYITADLSGGCLPPVIASGAPCVLCSHWQGLYGLHAGDRRGFRALQTVVERLRQLDPAGERTRWRRPSEITRHACALALAAVRTDGLRLHLDLPLRVPEFTVRLDVRGALAVRVDSVPLRRVQTRRDFDSGSFLVEGGSVLAAFDPAARNCVLEVEAP